MAKIEVEVDEQVARLIAKKDRRIAKLEEDLATAQSLALQQQELLKRLAGLRKHVVETADWLEPYRYDDL